MDLFNKVHIFQATKSHIYDPNISLIGPIMKNPECHMILGTQLFSAEYALQWRIQDFP